MIRVVASLIAASAVYGFAIGSVHSSTYALRNLIKFPLLLTGTALTCGFAYFICGRIIVSTLSFVSVQRLVWRVYRDTAVLLASLGLVCIFLAYTLAKPTRSSLNEYPLFLGLNVVFIAASGSLSLVRQAKNLLRDHVLSRAQSIAIVTTWLGLSLAVGGQWAWYLRPFFGVSSLPDGPFFLGAAPDFRGARSFYEALYQLVDPSRG